MRQMQAAKAQVRHEKSRLEEPETGRRPVRAEWVAMQKLMAEGGMERQRHGESGNREPWESARKKQERAPCPDCC